MKRLAYILAAALLASCVDADPIDAPASAGDPIPDHQAAEGPSGAMNLVSRTLAMGLHDRKVRTELLQQLRASPYSAHKIHLDEFLSTPSGNEVLERGRRDRGSPLRGSQRH